MAVHLLEDWCKGKCIDPKKSFLVTRIPEGHNEETVASALQTFEGVKECKVNGIIFRREDNAYAALCELKVSVDTLQIPGEVEIENRAWKLITSSSYLSSSSEVEFLKKMTCFLEKEGKTMKDIPGLLGITPTISTPNIAVSPEVWTQAFGKALENVIHPHPESIPYWKLSLFSGGSVQIPGEEGFEKWFENASEMLQEWQVSDGEKRRCVIIESLRGPALDVIRTLKINCLKSVPQIV
uniref:paraneoplastic antigen Ma1 homolog n=1 Tax=Euleptes europaea TaxID=460621 RepID=UPI002542207D|nr:paraneoplastic antigen Ma1 homolog [Euleptes europaea]